MSEPDYNIGVVQDELKPLVDRIIRLKEERDGITADMRNAYAEAKAKGFDTKTIRKLIPLVEMDRHDRDEQMALLRTHSNVALGYDIFG